AGSIQGILGTRQYILARAEEAACLAVRRDVAEYLIAGIVRHRDGHRIDLRHRKKPVDHFFDSVFSTDTCQGKILGAGPTPVMRLTQADNPHIFLPRMMNSRPTPCAAQEAASALSCGLS